MERPKRYLTRPIGGALQPVSPPHAGPAPNAVAFSDLALRLGLVALPGPGARVLTATPAALGAYTRSARPSAAGVGAVVEVDDAAIAAAAQQDPVAAVLATALAAVAAPAPPPRFMGVVNVTPDSFSDGGRFLDPERALEHGLALAAAGASLLDVGGESTRPGAAPVSAEEELARVLPVVEGLVRAGAPPVSIDTTKAAVARAAVAAGAEVINDVSAGEADPELLAVAAELGVEYVLMHRQGQPGDMQRNPTYGDPVLDVAAYLRRRVRACLDSGLALSRITLDPGLGFGKRLPHNLALLARLGELRSLGLPLLVGPSRKSFIAHITGAEKETDWAAGRRSDAPHERLGGTAAAVLAALAGGASVLRVHDVRVMVEAAAVARAIRSAPLP